MDIDFSLHYSPNEENEDIKYEEVGYHKTFSVYKNSIIKSGFKLSNEDDDWLGEGVYFWDKESNAHWWKKRQNGIMGSCIFKCLLSCKQNNFLNLDDKNEMRNMDDFSQRYLKEAKKINGAKPMFANNNQRKKFFCDIYCRKHHYEILSFTFEHDIINISGFKVGSEARRQICVRNPENIQILNIKEVS